MPEPLDCQGSPLGLRAAAPWVLTALLLGSCSGGGGSEPPAPPPAACTAQPVQVTTLACTAGRLGTFVQTRSFDASPGVCAYRPATDTSATSCFPAFGYRWKPLAIGGGGFITGIDLNPDGITRLARADVYGAYLWDTASDRWVQLVTRSRMPPEDRDTVDLGGAYDVVSAPSDPNRLYLFLANRVFRSDDRGGSWQRTAFPLTSTNDANGGFRTWRTNLAVDPRNPDVVLAGTTSDGVRLTRDGGASWSTVTAIPVGGSSNSSGPAGNNVFFDASSAASGGSTTVAYADSAGNGVWRSSDGGRSWQQVAGGPDTPKAASRAEVASDGTVYAVDGLGFNLRNVWRYRGGRWANISPEPGVFAASVTVDPANPNRIYAWTGGGQGWRSLDGGGTWTKLQMPNIRTATGDVGYLAFTDQDFFTNAQVKFDPKVPGRLWVAQGFGVWKADVTDSTLRVEWRAESRGIEELVTNDIVSAPGQTVVTAHWDQSIFLHDTPDAFPTRRYPTRDFNSTWQMDWTPAQPGYLVANTTSHLFCCKSRASFQAGWSADNGKTWNTFATQPMNEPFVDANVLAFWNGGIAVAADNPDNIVWAGLGEASIERLPYVTRDRGATWRPVALPAPASNETLGFSSSYFLNRKILAADKVAPGTFYLYSSSLRTTARADGGTDLSPGSLAGVWRSTDGGQTWQQRFVGWLTDFSVFHAHLKAVPGQAGHLFFTPGPLQGNPNQPLRRSTDGGATWTNVPGATNVRDVGFGRALSPGQPAASGGYPTIYFVGSYRGTAYGIWRSTDNGASFVQIGDYADGRLDGVNTVEGDKNVFGRVYLGYGGSGVVVGDVQP